MAFNKVLLIHFRGCQHTRVVKKEDVARVVEGTRAGCPKCDYQLRTIAEQSWVDPKKIEE